MTILTSDVIHVLDCDEDTWYQHILREFPTAYFEADDFAIHAKLNEHVSIYDIHPYIGTYFLQGKQYIHNGIERKRGNCWIREKL